MCKWPVSHMVLFLMVNVHIGLLFRMFFTLLWMLLSQNSHLTFLLDYVDYESFLAFYFFKIGMLKRNIFWINFDVFRKNFVILRISGQNIIGKCYLNVYVASIFSFLIC